MRRACPEDRGVKVTEQLAVDEDTVGAGKLQEDEEKDNVSLEEKFTTPKARIADPESVTVAVQVVPWPAVAGAGEQDTLVEVATGSSQVERVFLLHMNSRATPVIV